MVPIRTTRSTRSLWRVIGMIAFAVTDKVRGQAVKPLAQSWQGELPVGPASGAGPGALQEKDGLVVTLPRTVEVGLVGPGLDVGFHGLSHVSLLELQRDAPAPKPRLFLWPRRAPR